MELCKFCGRKTGETTSCIACDIIIDGIKYTPITHRSKKGLIFGEKKLKCPVCAVVSGGYHHLGCSEEICPKCFKRWIYCKCSGRKVKTDNASESAGNVIDFRKKKRTLSKKGHIDY